MALRSISATGLRDDARLLGLVLQAGALALIDVEEAQLPDVQAAIDRGDVSVSGMAATPPPKAKGK